jgi:Tol biopolymer transport system component
MKCLVLLIVFSAVSLTGTTRVNAEYIAEGVQLVQLTQDGQSRALAWAWHGDWITVLRDIPGSRQNQLFVMKADGTNQQEITEIGDTFFVEWSWSGDKLAYMFANSWEPESQAGVFVYDFQTQRTHAASAPYRHNVLDADEGPVWSVDDRYVAYKARPGVAQLREVWLHDTKANKLTRLLSDRGEVRNATWSRQQPDLIGLRVAATGGWDLASVRPDGKDLTLLTDIGAESLGVEAPNWSPQEDLIAFIYNKDMMQQERDEERGDCWIIRPDGSGARNLTQATSPATEKQLKFDELCWSWDGRWILGLGERYDIQGREIETLYLMDPRQGGYRILLTSYPQKDAELEKYLAYAWSYDSTKIAVLSERRTVRNWSGEARYERFRTALSVVDLATDTRTDILVFDHEQDRKRLLGETDREPIESLSWSPDSRSLLLTVATIISETDNLLQPDVVRVDLPEHFISSQASEYDGPTMRGAQRLESPELSSTLLAEVSPGGISTATSAAEEIIIEAIRPQHLTVQDSLASLPSQYASYLTPSASENIMVFEGTADKLARPRELMRIIDKKTPQILVDLMAVELTDEANRELGLDWTYAEGHIGLYQPIGNAVRDLTPDPGLSGLTTFPGAGQLFYQGVGTLPREFFVRLNALVSDGNGTILANPRTVATSGKESMIQIRKTLNYFFTEGFDTFGRPIVKKSDISSDTQGQITPTLLDDNRIHMMVDIKVGSFTFSALAGLPEQISRQSTTEVTVVDGETLIIGGLRQQEMTQTTVKVPLLGDIPLLGPLFRKTKKEVHNSVLTLFITPHLLQEDQVAPDWIQLDPNEHLLKPIMPEPKRPK